MILQAAALGVLFCSVQTFTIQGPFENGEEYSGHTVEDDEFSVSTLLEKANVNVGKNLDEPLVMFGDIAVPTGLQNADPCVTRGCLWPKATDGNVYVPFRIANSFSNIHSLTQSYNNNVIPLYTSGLTTCIRLVIEQFLSFRCFSFVGRRGRGQVVSLSRQGCVFRQIIQHELLHALGFNHEQTRSDRDQNVRILLGNVISGMESNFRKIQTMNLGTPYDYNSVMHYGRFAFSKNRQPTIVPIPNANVAIGRATQMSPIDILRVNRLYRCNSTAFRPDLKPMQRNHFL
uniref:Metalloendopeptidase n=1 Tax=Gasterosteus aculeatus aculeatus TaxID=481459 RepID=A0AAQ4QM80_GASAC